MLIKLPMSLLHPLEGGVYALVSAEHVMAVFHDNEGATVVRLQDGTEIHCASGYSNVVELIATAGCPKCHAEAQRRSRNGEQGEP